MRRGQRAGRKAGSQREEGRKLVQQSRGRVVGARAARAPARGRAAPRAVLLARPPAPADASLRLLPGVPSQTRQRGLRSRVHAQGRGLPGCVGVIYPAQRKRKPRRCARWGRAPSAELAVLCQGGQRRGHLRTPLPFLPCVPRARPHPAHVPVGPHSREASRC